MMDSELLIWRAILVTGIAAYFLNDAGVLAFALCIVYGFSYALAGFIEKMEY
jgi:hypothetical protein